MGWARPDAQGSVVPGYIVEVLPGPHCAALRKRMDAARGVYRATEQGDIRIKAHNCPTSKVATGRR